MHLLQPTLLRVLAVTMSVWGFGVLSIAPALAAPSNDTLPGAEVVGNIPYIDTMDTASATKGALDGHACTGSGTTSSVWYKLVPARDRTFTVDAVRSDYPVLLSVFERTDAGIKPVHNICSSRVTDFYADAGKTYYILAYNNPHETPTSGNLVLRIRNGLRPVVHLNAEGTVSHATGDAYLEGTVTCNRSSVLYYGYGTLRQRISDTAIAVGESYADFGKAKCSPASPAPFVIRIVPSSITPFRAGYAGAREVSVSICDDVGCTEGNTVEALVLLRWVR